MRSLMQQIIWITLIAGCLGNALSQNEESRSNLRVGHSRENTCPNPEDILPCECIFDEQLSAMDMNCSLVQDEQQLRQVFQSNVPNKQFRALIITNNPHIRVLENGVFSDFTFQRIDIMDGVLDLIEEAALTGSASTVFEMNFHRNNITDFPFLSLREFSVLENLNLHYNKIKEIPVFMSGSLKEFYIFGNPLAHLPVDSLSGLPNLKTFGVSEADIPEIYPGLFDNQLSLRNVYMQENRLTSIPSGAFRTSGKTFFHIVLDDNLIVEVAEGAFPDMKEHTSIYLYNNRIRLLEENVWRPLLENDVTVWLSGNPLTCGCDAAWAVLNPDLLRQLPNAHCESGVDLADLDPGIFESC
ncbi:oplophorus-luciferin 2-monooxygenase non-catalytic subunit-like [Penaeus japonicus]|uniref:oplophorus-luciferin 2-monooxygenase non-catalytic subunit-like n=1 Tax=Penaeus japonicus TaxID=27405 RepID=UPI001C70E302|nr:oplophorus-luciferin 2-monooxygenase non-catalytic subunit-like [Penaeus japonicus]